MTNRNTTCLDVDGVRVRRGLEQVVGAPADGIPGVRQLRLHEATELHHAPRQHRHAERHREPELDVVAGVVVPAHQVHLPAATRTVDKNNAGRQQTNS